MATDNLMIIKKKVHAAQIFIKACIKQRIPCLRTSFYNSLQIMSEGHFHLKQTKALFSNWS